MGISPASLQVCACELSAAIAEAEYIIVVGAPAGRHTPRVEVLQPTQLPAYLPNPLPFSSPMVPSMNLLLS